MALSRLGESPSESSEFGNENLEGKISSFKKEIMESIEGMSGVMVGGTEAIPVEKFLDTPEGWNFVLPEGAVKNNGKEDFPFGTDTNRWIATMNGLKEKDFETKNRMEIQSGMFQLPYNHYKIEDLENTPEFQVLMQTIDNLLDRENGPRFEESVLQANPELKELQQFTVKEYVVWGHASPLNAGEDPYTGGEIEAVDDQGNELTGNEALAWHRAQAAKQYLLDKGVPAEKITVKYTAHETLPDEFYGQKNPRDKDIPGVGLHIVGARWKKTVETVHQTTQSQPQEQPEGGGLFLTGLPEEQIKDIEDKLEQIRNGQYQSLDPVKPINSLELIADLTASKKDPDEG